MKLNKTCLLSTLMLSFLHCSANASIDLLSIPSKQSHIAHKSVTMALLPVNEHYISVGERGHILRWENEQQWQQEQSPVSVSLTSVTIQNNGGRIAVGQDAVILKSEPDSNTWNKVFDGFELSTLKVAAIQQQISELTAVIEQTEDEDLVEELEFQLEDLTFGLEDAEGEIEAGPNKPLLAVTEANNGALFAVGAYGTLLTSDDSGQSWKLIENRLDNFEKFHLNDIIKASDGTLYIVGESGLGFVSKDNGETWQTMEIPYGGSIFGIRNQPNSNNIVAFGLQGNFMTSSDGGMSWEHQHIASGASFLGGTVGNTGDVFLVGHGGMIVNFPITKINEYTITKHKSGAAFSDVEIAKGQLILAGQLGITTLSIK